MTLTITLVAAATAALINIWLMMRVGKVRGSEKVSIGDGGNERVIARMRAHANFVEYTPFVLILVGLIELARGSMTWLWIVVALFMIGRVLHGLGMDGLRAGRAIATAITFLTLLVLALYALYIPYSTPAVTELKRDIRSG